MREGNIAKAEMHIVQRLADAAKADKTRALNGIASAVDATCTQIHVIEPSKAVVNKTLGMFPTKSLQPFDEMVMGAVLTQAELLQQEGCSGFYFCNLNKADFDPTNRPVLATEYQRLTITYLASFLVP